MSTSKTASGQTHPIPSSGTSPATSSSMSDQDPASTQDAMSAQELIQSLSHAAWDAGSGTH